MISRRAMLAATLGASVAGLARAQPAPPNLGANRLVLLGTRGGPFIGAGVARNPSASVLVYDGVPYVIDTGYGVSFRLVEAKIPLNALRYIFITHHHSDHNAEFGLLLNNAWAWGLRTQVDAYGPAGLQRLADGFWDAYKFDIETRMADQRWADLRKLVAVHEFAEGPVMAAGSVKVTALRNVHPPVTDSFALKFELGDKTIVFSGDTAYFPQLAAFAKGADILVHEAIYRPGLEQLTRSVADPAALMAHLIASHTTAEDVGRIATEAGVKQLVLNHLAPADGVADQVWIDAVRTSYAGDLVIGHDLLEVKI